MVYNGPNQKGFTLIELLVVIAIMALLISIALPSLSRAKEMALRMQCAHNMRQIDLAMNLYVSNFDGYYPSANDPISTDPHYWLWMGRGWRYLLDPYLSSDQGAQALLICPQDDVAEKSYENTSYAYSMSFYHSPARIDSMTSVADAYSNPRRSTPQQAQAVRFPSAKIIIGEWLSNHDKVEDDPGWWGWQGRRNYLFVDGRIDYIRAVDVLASNNGFPDANLTKRGIRGRDVD